MSMRERVVEAAESVLARDGQIGPLELLQQIGFLYCGHVEQWQRGNEYYTDLESHIQCGEKKLKETWDHFFHWVEKKKLEPVKFDYKAKSRYADQNLHVTVNGEPERETFYRTHFRSTNISPAKKKQLDAKQSKLPDLVRAWIRHQHTEYDKLLMRGLPREEAREAIAEGLERTLGEWT